MRTRLLLAAIGIITIAVQGQTPAPPPLVETMEVRVVNVEVVVTDRNGNRVTGLTQDDFEIFEKRKKQVITNFSEIGDSAAPAVTTPEQTTAPTTTAKPRRSSVIFFIDTTSLDPRRRKDVFEELRRFAGTALRPGDRAMIAVWNRKPRVALAFTESAEDVQRALYEVENDAGGVTIFNNRRLIQQRVVNELETSLENQMAYPIAVAYAAAVGHATTYAEEMYAHARSLALAVSRVLSSFGVTDDKKALVYVGDYLPSKAGIEMFDFVEQTFQQYYKEGGALTLRSVSADSWIDQLTKAANAAGVTAYMISGSGLKQVSVDAAQSDAVSSSVAEMVEAETRKTFVRTAEETGGIAYTGGDARDVLQKIADDFRSYYSLGFRPTGTVDGKSREIVVKAKNPEYRVRARQSYVLRSLADEMEERVTSNLYLDEAPGELIVRAQAETPIIDGRNKMKVPVKVYVQGKNITLLPRGAAKQGEVTVFVCAGSAEAGASKVLKHTQRLVVPGLDELRFRGGHLTFSFEVLVNRKGENTVSAGVLDVVGGIYGLARTTVEGDPVQAVKKPPVSTDY